MCLVGNEHLVDVTRVLLNDRIGFCSSDRPYNNNSSLVEVNHLLVAFQGVLYNKRSLREKLSIGEHRFDESNTAEVIAYGFLEYGVELFNQLTGRFSIAIFDSRSNTLIIARDRVGEEPLFSTQTHGLFLFSTSLKSLLSSGYVEKKISTSALNQYLQLTYIPAPLSIIENVYKLLPGHYLTIDREGAVSITQYWNVSYSKDSLIADYDVCKTQLREAVFHSVEEMIGESHSYGTFLSGGIDSTIITGITSQLSPSPIDTFTIGYRDRQYDESDHAKISSAFHNTNNHLLILESEEALAPLDDIISSMEEPLADASMIPTYAVFKLAKDHISTACTGDGGDELFGGYSRYLISYYADRFNKLPGWSRRLIRGAVFGLPDTSLLTRKLRKVITNAEKDIFEQRLSLMCLGFRDDDFHSLMNHQYRKDDHLSLIREYYDEMSDAGSELSQTLYMELKVFLEGAMLPKIRNANALVGLQTRSPLLHTNVVELAARIPSQFKIQGRDTKVILKETFEDLIPKELRGASKKGFEVPLGSWLRRELKSELEAVLNSERILSQGIFNPEYIQEIMKQHQEEETSRTNELWSLYVLEKWLAFNEIGIE
jgi:asparagine synthase (glutamine-hydrolysing)